jgi:predicted HicB family RNase H-like nuclease
MTFLIISKDRRAGFWKSSAMNKTELRAKVARYVKMVEWSDEDACFVGTCPGLMYGGIHGKDEAEVYAELCRAVEEVVELMEREGHRLPPPSTKKKYSGKVLLRISPAIHQRLALQARAGGESLNALVTRKLVTV